MGKMRAEKSIAMKFSVESAVPMTMDYDDRADG
jgi:hypothetical protein